MTKLTFTQKELLVMNAALVFNPDKVTARTYSTPQQPAVFEIYKQLKPHLKDDKLPEGDYTLTLDTIQKKLILDMVESHEWPVPDIEPKLSLTSKLL